MRVDQVLDDGEAKAGAAEFAAAGFIDAVEAHEEAGLVVMGDAHAGVAHEEFHPVGDPISRRSAGPGDGFQAGGDPAAFGRVFDGVIEEVAHDLVESLGIAEDFAGIGTGLVVDGDVLLFGDGADGVEDVGEEGVGAVGGVAELLGAEFEAGEDEEVGGEAREAFGVVADDVEEADVVFGIVKGAAEQGFGVAAPGDRVRCVRAAVAGRCVRVWRRFR